MIKHLKGLEISTIYDFDNAFSINELLCKFWEKIEETINISNESIDILNWVKEQGLPDEVQVLINQLVADGTIEQMINVDKIEELRNLINSRYSEISLQMDKVTSNNLRIINAMEYIDFEENVDCSTDINSLIQSMKKNETLILPYFNYYINNTVVIDKDINFICNGIINYSGNDSAIKIIQSQNKKIEFTRINATSGTCIELFSNTGNFIQYLELKFKELFAKKYCLFLNLESASHGWINENRFYGGRFSSGEIGCYANAHNLDSINSNKFFEIGVEGVDLGYSFNNLCNYTYISNPRILETRNLINTSGTNKDLRIIGTNILYASKINFSSDTNGYILMPIVDDGGGLITNTCTIFNGKIVLPPEKRRYKNCGNPSDGVFDLRNETKAIEYNIFYFLVGQNVTSLILNELYGKEIYEFYVKLNFDSGKALNIKDSKENIIFNNTTDKGWSLLRFNYCSEMGWIAEKVNTISLTT